ncbi:MAG TPA: hypothetical protein ENI76_07065 [Ignavibacteria bacterium]|nr:hypothetical protein [Ignavibacteria bacterium]
MKINKQTKRYVILMVCLTYLLQPLFALASSVECTFHEDIIGITFDTGGQFEQQVLVLALSSHDNDHFHQHDMDSNSSMEHGTGQSDDGSTAFAAIISSQQNIDIEPSHLFQRVYHNDFFRSIFLKADIRPPISA